MHPPSLAMWIIELSDSDHKEGVVRACSHGRTVIFQSVAFAGHLFLSQQAKGMSSVLNPTFPWERSEWAWLTTRTWSQWDGSLQGSGGWETASLLCYWFAFSLQKGEADAVSLDGAFIYVAGRCGLVPVLAESYSRWRRSSLVFSSPWPWT